MLAGFGWDYSGTVLSWEGGRLEKYQSNVRRRDSHWPDSVGCWSAGAALPPGYRLGLLTTRPAHLMNTSGSTHPFSARGQLQCDQATLFSAPLLVPR